jgi:putative mRNA 3-end processing factor
MKKLLRLTDRGIYCEKGNFFIDPRKPVDKAVITHAHSDHARHGSKNYLTAAEGELILRFRLGSQANISTLNYGAKELINGVTISFHPAGHILGSSQVRVEYKGEVWVVTGDYKIEPDPTCTDFEPVRCNYIITESTFALPVYNWRPQSEVYSAINEWWKKNKENRFTSILFVYALGKAQRVIAALDSGIGNIYTHGAVENMNVCYRESGVKLTSTGYIGNVNDKSLLEEAIIIAPLSADNPGWLKKFNKFSKAYASGWMQVRGTRRRLAADRGFVLSDHADWNGIIKTIKDSGAEKIYAMHGYTMPLARWLNENGWYAESVSRKYEGKTDEPGGGE